MKKNQVIKFSFLLAVSFLITNYQSLITVSHADIHTANSASYSDVNTAVSSASTGDTVIIPAGAATWNSGITTSKAISIIGAGSNLTIITNNAGTLFSFQKTGSNLARLSSIRINSSFNAYPVILLQGAISKVRIDHCFFDKAETGILSNIMNNGASGPVCGVVDHCTFLNMGGHGAYFAMDSRSGETYWGQIPWDSQEWQTLPGTDKMLYFEDCQFTYDSGLSACSNPDATVYGSYGGRVCLRYNTFTGLAYNYLDAHGDNPDWSTLYYEVYNNTFTAGPYTGSSGGTAGRTAYLRGGMFIIHDNTFIGGKLPVELTKYWSYDVRIITNTYIWGNTLDGDTNQTSIVDVRDSGQTPPGTSAAAIKLDRNYFLHAPQSGQTFYPYTPLVYPHPLVTVDSGDTTPPSAPAVVRDGTGAVDAIYTTQTTALSANWNASSDPETGISGYRYAIGTSPEGTDVAGWTALGNVLTVTKTGLSLTGGTTYYFSVKALNGAGLESSAANTDGQFVKVWVADTTPPSAPSSVRDGTGAVDVDTALSKTQLSANWDSATDAETGVNIYSYVIGTAAGGSNIKGWTNLGNILNVTATGLNLTAGTTYYFSVKAQNRDGYWGQAANSDGQYVTGDTTPPGAPAAVRDGTSMTDSVYTFSTAQLSANWDQAADSESGISKYYFAIGLSPGATDITNWTDNGTTRSITRTGLSLTIGTTYYFSVKAQNGDGLQGSAMNSNGQYVVKMDTADTTPPSTPGEVRDGLGTDISYTYSATQLSANWDASTDNESGIINYQFSIGTTPGSTDITNGWISNGVNTSVTKAGLSLTAGTTYYFSVKAQNGVGLQGVARNSNGQVLLENTAVTAPIISNVFVNATKTGAAIIWNTDKPCTGHIEYGQTALYGFITDPSTELVVSHSVSLTGLRPGTVYHYRIIVRDAGYVESITPDNTFLTSGDSQSNVKAYPNPCSISKDRQVTFLVGAGVKAEVKIYTVTGRLVKKIQDENGTGEITWDATNEDGEKILTGVYLYKVTVTNEDTMTGKLAIVK